MSHMTLGIRLFTVGSNSISRILVYLKYLLILYTYVLNSLMLFAIVSWPRFTAISRGVR